MLTGFNYFNNKTPVQKLFPKLAESFRKIIFRTTHQYCLIYDYVGLHYTNNTFPFNIALKMKFPNKDFFSKCGQIRRKL